jgi:hypothetical protein
MRKFYLIAFCMFFLCVNTVVKAQGGFQPGFVILNDGTRVGGSISLNEGEPWFNQRRIWFKDSVAMLTNPNVKPKKYKVEDLKSYRVGDRKFEKVHYVDYENLQIKSMGSNDHMLEMLSSGRITSYKFYTYPQDFYAFYGTEDAYKAQEQKKKNDLLKGFKFLTKKDNEEKFHDAFDYDLQKFFEDTPEVLQKYQAGGYGNQPVNAKKGLMAKMIAHAKKVAYKPEEADAIVLAFNDYNQRNPGK